MQQRPAEAAVSPCLRLMLQPDGPWILLRNTALKGIVLVLPEPF